MALGECYKLYGASWVCQKNKEGMSWKVVGNVLRISLGMLSNLGVFPLARFLRLLSKTYFVLLLLLFWMWRRLGASCLKYEAICAMP